MSEQQQLERTVEEGDQQQADINQIKKESQ